MSENLTKTTYITLDIDWACDEVITDTLDLLDSLDLPATIFITHDTPLLKRMRKNPRIELGIHPNFCPLLQGRSVLPDYHAVIHELITLVPEAICARSHALVDASPILVAFAGQGFRLDMNMFVPFSSGICLTTFKHYSGLTRAPYFYEDDAYCFETDKRTPEAHLLEASGSLQVFNFHPIHLYLNTETMTRYERARPYFQDFPNLEQFVNQDPENGARAFLNRLVNCARTNGYTFGKASDLL